VIVPELERVPEVSIPMPPVFDTVIVPPGLLVRLPPPEVSIPMPSVFDTMIVPPALFVRVLPPMLKMP